MGRRARASARRPALLRLLLHPLTSVAAAIAVLLPGCSRQPPVAPFPNASGRSADERAALDADFIERMHELNGRTGATAVPVSTLQQWLAADLPVVLLDVRGAAEFEISHLPGALRLPPDTAGTAPLPTIPPDARIVAYCTAGYRSGLAAVALASRLGRPVVNLAGGIIAWSNAGGGLVDPSGEPVDVLHPWNTDWGRYVHPRTPR